MTETPQRVLVVVPTYDERENLPGALDRLRTHVPDADVLVVDDGSPDGTGELAEKIAEAETAQEGTERIHVLHRAGKLGLGTAYVAGFRWALDRGYDVVVEMDADGSHRAEDLPRLLGAIDHADLVLGSRWVPGGSVQNWPMNRLLLSRGANTYTRLALGIPLYDATGGFRAYRASLLSELTLQDVASQGYCFQVDMAWRAVRSGARVVEVPITFVERELGRSKMSRAIVVEALVNVTRWGIAERSRRVAGAFRRSRG
ncbi:polyprenol monophosphomannose synthase [Cellulomonas humilata]|uniref:Polyprenol monophosphomannose synthase n=1 Tax=Cellulomonas humilata TaxID=144055 RepID=A0A7Y6A3A8_9CELL|nr:polyprenol monophosphomannose synthase [Cellulomonas humilata]NUU17704.1 polyprenol monophosphomannose synthase [Cellulomonas humilata]